MSEEITKEDRGLDQCVRAKETRSFLGGEELSLESQESIGAHIDKCPWCGKLRDVLEVLNREPTTNDLCLNDGLQRLEAERAKRRRMRWWLRNALLFVAVFLLGSVVWWLVNGGFR